jgi:hypothetical protein
LTGKAISLMSLRLAAVTDEGRGTPEASVITRHHAALS